VTDHHAGEDVDAPDLEEIRAEDAAAREREDLVWEAAFEQDREPADDDLPDASVDQSACRWCETEFKNLTQEADHICPDRREFEAWDRDDDVPLVEPQIHELETALLFDEHGQSPYWAMVSEFDRCFQDTHVDEEGNTVATDDEVGEFDAAGETWSLNHDEGKVKYWEGKIAADGQDFDRYFEYNIGLVADDDVERKRVNLQFRVAHPDMCHAITGDPIKSLPDDLPDGVRVQTDSANVDLDTVFEVLRAFAEEITVNPEYFARDALHPWSRVTDLALYLRIKREASEDKVVAIDSGLLDRLADFARRQRGRWEYKGDNREIMGHRTHVATCNRTRSAFYPAVVGTMLKSYHMKTPNADPLTPTDHPKLECQFSTEYSETGPIPLDADLGVDYAEKNVPEGYDFESLYAELDEWLLNCVHWAGLPVRADESVYEADAYWDVTESVRDRHIRQSPLGAARDQEQDLAEYHVLRADATPAQRAVLKAVTDGGENQPVETVAENAGFSERTVYRAVDAFGDIMETVNGRLQMVDGVIREKASDLLGGLEDTLEWLDDSLDRLADGEDRLAEDSPFAKWLRTYGVEFDTTNHELHVHAGAYDTVEIRKLLRAGLSAARQTGPHIFDEVFRCSATWMCKDGDRREAVNPFALQGQSSIAVLGAHIARLG